MTRYIDGVELPVTTITPTHLTAIGHALANLHLLGRSYKKGIDNRFGFNRIVGIYREVRRQLPPHLKNIIRVLDDEFGYLENYLDNNLPKGIIHGDLFPDNVKFKGNRLTGVMDFEASCRGKLIYDLATAVNALCFIEDRYQIDRFEALIAGYESLRPLSLPEWDSFPNELRFSALRFTVTRIKDFYLKKMDESLTGPQRLQRVLRPIINFEAGKKRRHGRYFAGDGDRIRLPKIPEIKTSEIMRQRRHMPLDLKFLNLRLCIAPNQTKQRNHSNQRTD